MKKTYILLAAMMVFAAAGIIFAGNALAATETQTFSFPNDVQLVDGGSNWIAYCQDPATVTQFCKAKGFENYVSFTPHYIGPTLYNDLVYKWNGSSFAQVGGLGCDTVAENIVCKKEKKEKCIPDWNCCDWGECRNGWLKRTCTDRNNCGLFSGKPEEEKSCTEPNNDECVWKGHCKGDPCSTYDDCDGSLVCNSGKCGPQGEGDQDNGNHNPPPPPPPNHDECVWKGHCKGDPCSTYDDCDGSLVCNSGKCGPEGDQDNGDHNPPPPPPPVCKEITETQTFSFPNDVQLVDGGSNWIAYCQDPATVTQFCKAKGFENYVSFTPHYIGPTLYNDLVYKWNGSSFAQVGGLGCDTVAENIVCKKTKCEDGNNDNDDNKKHFERGMVSFSFDDGWQSFYNNGIPLLDKYGIKSTSYIISSEIGDAGNGYMSLDEILDMQNRGHEIGDHTKTHPDLTLLSQDQISDEILGSKQDLESMGINHISSFDYPFGAYNGTVEQTIRNGGYLGARTADNGDNYAGDNPYLLKVMSIESTTPVSEVMQRIDSAINNKTWLILLFHQVEDNGGQYSISPDRLSQIIDYVNQNNVKTVKISEGLAEMTN